MKAKSQGQRLQVGSCAVAVLLMSPFTTWAEPRAGDSTLAPDLAQGKRQAFHEALLAMKGDMTKESILAAATAVGLDAKRLDADMANPEWQAVIEKNRALARDLGISGTPGFIVGTELVPGALDLKGLKDLITRAGE